MKRTLIIGGSGFVSGAMARWALTRGGRGNEVWGVTRGVKKGVEGVRMLTADRNDPGAWGRAMAEAPAYFDVVVDCIAFEGRHGGQDVETFFPEGGKERAGQLIVLSSDFAVSAADRPVWVDETYERFDTAPYGAGKRAVEEVVLGEAKRRGLPVTVLRPCHIYGPGSLLGCLPRHGRDAELLERIRRGETLKLIGGGHFLQHPLYVDDLCAVAFGCAGNKETWGEVFFVGGSEVVESRGFYRIIGEIVGREAVIEECSIAEYLREWPEHRAFCCHRLYRMGKLEGAGVGLPKIGLEEGLRRHVAWLELRESSV